MPPQSHLVLGITTAHPDTSAVLVNDQGVVAAISEERINRKKHSAAFPRLAIQEVLRMGGATIADVTDIAIARDPKANAAAKAKFMLANPSAGISTMRKRFGVQREAMGLGENFAEATGVQEADIKAAFHRVEHHLAHVASSFYWSPYDKCAGISVDGAGDFATAMIAKCEGTKIEILNRCYWPHSLGVLYTSVCHFIGFTKYGEEYKVMGLAAYGEPKYMDQMAKLATYDPERGIRLNLDYFQHHKTAQMLNTESEDEILTPQMWSDKMKELFGENRQRKTPLGQRENDIAASLQAHFEKLYLALIADAVAKTGYKTAAMAGGCALNGVGNGKCLMQGILDDVYFQPAASDDGTAAGAAAWVLHNKLGAPRTPAVWSGYWGTSWTDDQIEKDIKASGFPYQKLTRDGVVAKAVEALSQGRIMGWFQGREEWGPRALGNRSILCHPGWPDMKATLNARVKNREPFRPFAPVVLENRLKDCFHGTQPVPFMNVVFKVRAEWKERLSATTHEDDTGRVQTVRREQNEIFHDLITAFDKKTGIPVVLNTSFNENEPIVHTPAQAIDCVARTHMDALGIGNFWLEKPGDHRK